MLFIINRETSKYSALNKREVLLFVAVFPFHVTALGSAIHTMWLPSLDSTWQLPLPSQ